MKICILGWYGTENLGDRAILDGLFHIFYRLYGKCNIFLGSIHPILTERTLLEDGRIYEESCPGIKIILFDEKNTAELRSYIKKSELIAMGGGPFMDILELDCMDYAFRYARKLGIKTAVLGCGIGTIDNVRWQETSRRIFENSDLIIFRDKNSAEHARQRYCQEKEVYALDDPAALSIFRYKNSHPNERQNYLVINYRKFPKFDGEQECRIEKEDFLKLIIRASECFPEVRLMPMHTFFVGGDDREYFTELLWGSDFKNVSVLHKPMNLKEAYELISGAGALIGMRYHCVVMQTILNGNNYILDYTPKGKGKIGSFLQMADVNGFYTKRYFNLQEDNKLNADEIMDCLLQGKIFSYKRGNRSEEEYIRLLNKL